MSYPCCYTMSGKLTTKTLTGEPSGIIADPNHNTSIQFKAAPKSCHLRKDVWIKFTQTSFPISVSGLQKVTQHLQVVQGLHAGCLESVLRLSDSYSASFPIAPDQHPQRSPSDASFAARMGTRWAYLQRWLEGAAQYLSSFAIGSSWKTVVACSDEGLFEFFPLHIPAPLYD